MKTVKPIVLSGLFIAVGLVLPFITGQIPEIGSRLLPMHLPVLLCGFVCGWPYGLAVGAITPLFRSLLFSMPMIYPTAIAMAFELAAYGFMAGLLYQKLPKRPVFVYISLAGSMIFGRLIWGASRYLLIFFGDSSFSISLFFAEGFLNAVPGIILQLVFIPLLVFAINGVKKADGSSL